MKAALACSVAVGATAAVLATVASAAAAAPGCNDGTRRAAFAEDQRLVLERLRRVPGVDLTALRGAGDLAALVALGYDFPPHQYVSFRGMGFAMLDLERLASPPARGHPALLFYAPSPAAVSVTDPRDSLDFPYELAGWGYLARYDFVEAPSELPCVERADWFVHERGVHPFEDGGMAAVPPEERFHGEAVGSEAPSSDDPRDIGHERFWDIHVWRSDDATPSVSIVNPGRDIPGVDPEVGLNWFYPAFRAGVPEPHLQ